MFLPIVRQPQEIESFDPHKVETVGISCMCGKEVTLKDCLVVWTAKFGAENNAWYAACTSQCIVANVSMGAC